MMKKQNIINKFHTISGTALLIFAFLVLLNVPHLLQEQKENKEAGGQIGKSQIELAETDKSISIMSTTNDPFFDTQWYIENSGTYSNLSEVMKFDKESTKDIDMDVSEAWDSMQEAGLKKREVVVAVIDTGVDYLHPDLLGNMWINAGEIPGDNIDNDNNGYVDDVNGWDFYNDDSTVCHYLYSERSRINLASPMDNDNHGTHVAGIIAAVADNNIGIAGVASNISIKIMPLKINGGEKGDGSIADAIEAIKYATMMGADVCNLSWGTTQYDAGLEEAIKESGMLFVAAAGNSGADNDGNPMYPASLDLDNLISVTFIDADGDLTGYSNYGQSSVDVAAPGDDIYSTIVGTYDTMSGSSMAAPQVSAVAALLYACNDHLYASNVKDIITSNLKELDNLKKVTAYGGIPDAYKAVMASGSLVQDKEAPELSFETIFDENEMTVPVHIKDAGDSGIRVIKWIYGKKKIADFKHGVNGTTVVNNQVNLSKAGTYTFYAADYAGNETAVSYKVEEDKTAPKIMTTFNVAGNYKTRTVKVSVTDSQSGIKRVKYMPGIKRAEDFLPAGSGTELELKDGKGLFKVKKDGVYTIFAADNRGNVIVRPILIKTVKATEFKFVNNEKTMEAGDQFNLRIYIRPTGSTDAISYSSSDDKVAVVSSTGKVTALTEGEVYITAKTASGLMATCLITVKPKE